MGGLVWVPIEWKVEAWTLGQGSVALETLWAEWDMCLELRLVQVNDEATRPVWYVVMHNWYGEHMPAVFESRIFSHLRVFRVFEHVTLYMTHGKY